MRRVIGLRDRLADYLRALRRSVEMSQRELAKASGVNKNTIADLEAEHNFDPRLSTLERLGQVAGWAIVFVDKEGRIVKPYNGEIMLDEAGREFPAHLTVLRRLDSYKPQRRLDGYTFLRRLSDDGG